MPSFVISKEVYKNPKPLALVYKHAGKVIPKKILEGKIIELVFVVCDEDKGRTKIYVVKDSEGFDKSLVEGEVTQLVEDLSEDEANLKKIIGNYGIYAFCQEVDGKPTSAIEITHQTPRLDELVPEVEILGKLPIIPTTPNIYN